MRLSPSTKHLIKLIKKYFGRLKSVEAVFIAKDGETTRVWTITRGPKGLHLGRSARAIQARERKIKEKCPDLSFLFHMIHWGEGKKPLWSLPSAVGWNTICAYRR